MDDPATCLRVLSVIPQVHPESKGQQDTGRGNDNRVKLAITLRSSIGLGSQLPTGAKKIHRKSLAESKLNVSLPNIA
jgi:hypothetical protein